MKVCARCEGKFPGPGIEKDEKVYCCDRCAKGPGKMMFKAIPAVPGLLDLDLLPGLYIKD
jgi:hypothetical protein